MTLDPHRGTRAPGHDIGRAGAEAAEDDFAFQHPEQFGRGVGMGRGARAGRHLDFDQVDIRFGKVADDAQAVGDDPERFYVFGRGELEVHFFRSFGV